jgi:hypothetical protein
MYQFDKLLPLPIGVLCSKRAESNCAVTRPTLTFHRVAYLGVPLVKLFCLSFLSALLCVFLGFSRCMLQYLNKRVMGFHAFLSLKPPFQRTHMTKYQAARKKEKQNSLTKEIPG